MDAPLILVAEDEWDILELIVITLETHGLTNVIRASNGEEAVAEAKARNPALILMDVRMPKMTGYQACEVLKNDSATRGIPVVFLSAKGRDDEVRQGIDVGAEQYILKPFAPDELYERVADILKRSGYQILSG